MDVRSVDNFVRDYLRSVYIHLSIRQFVGQSRYRAFHFSPTLPTLYLNSRRNARRWLRIPPGPRNDSSTDKAAASVEPLMRSRERAYFLSGNLDDARNYRTYIGPASE